MEQNQPPTWETYRSVGIGLIIGGLLFAAGAVWMYGYLADLEARNIPLRGFALFVWIYDLGGKNLAVGLIGLFAVMFVGYGIATLRSGLRQRKAELDSESR